jgi:hypothetical protein
MGEAILLVHKQPLSLSKSIVHGTFRHCQARHSTSGGRMPERLLTMIRGLAKMFQGIATIQDVFYHAVFAVPLSMVTCWALYKLFAERLFGHIFDRQLAGVKATYDIKLEGVKAEYDVKLEGIKAENGVNLEAVRHGQNAEIENLRAAIAHLTDRGKHSNEREYAALSTIWEQYVELHYATTVVVTGFIQIDPLNTFTSDELEDFMTMKELLERQKKNIREVEDKETAYMRIVSWGRLNKVQTAYYDLNLILHKQGIFIPRDLKRKFEEGAELCLGAITERWAQEQQRGVGTKLDIEFQKKSPSLLESIKDSVRERLLRS